MTPRCYHCDLAVSRAMTSCPRCATPLHIADEPPVLVGGNYAIEREIGNGAMGVVYRARDVLLDRVVALKVINADLARNTAFVDRFCREARAMAAIRNDHVVGIFTMGIHDGSYFYAMEHVEGHDLEFILNEHRLHGSTVPTVRALTILREVSHGLAAVHAASLVHRDVKPANIMIENETGRPVLLDFGLARPMAKQALNATQIAGTAPYMAPEQIITTGEDDGLTARTDVYALGCTAFELFTGRTPFVSRPDQSIFETMQAHMFQTPPRLSSVRPDLEVFDAVLERALQKSPGDRFEGAMAFAEALDRAATQLRALGAAMPQVMPAPDDMSSLLPASDAFRVLVVDDDPDFCQILTRAVETALKGVPVSVSLTQNGFKALARALRVPPQLVILDFDMPEMNGVETLSHLREIPGAAQAPVLVVSGNFGAVEQWRFSVLGVRDFLRKPVNLWDLVDTIARLARRARASAAPTQTLVEDGLPPPRPSHRLPVEVFMGFLAAAWADGRLDDLEREAVLEAAASEGLGDEEMERVRQGTLARVELDDLDFSTLNRTDRLYTYAVALWIANLDNKITAREEATLRVLRVTLGVSDRERGAMEAALRELTQNPEHRTPQRFDFQGLRRVIAAHVASAS